MRDPICNTSQANEKAAGYYRFHYTGGLLGKLVDGDPAKHLSAAERVDLLGNTLALMQSGQMPAANALALVPVFRKDSERHVISGAFSLAISPRHHLVTPAVAPRYAEFIRVNFQAKARELGWTPKPGEPDEAKLLRSNLVGVVAAQGHDQTLANEARSLTNQWLKTRSGIDPSMLTSALGAAAYYGDTELAERFISVWASLDAQQQQSLLQAMFWFRDPKAVEALLQAVVSGKLPLTPASWLFFYAGQESSESRGVPFRFLQTHYEAILKLFADNPIFGKSQLPMVGQGFCDAQSKSELKSFFEPRLAELSGATRILAQVLESIDQCIAIKERQGASVTAFLETQ